MVHQHDAIDAVRRTVTRAARPALAPLRAAAATLHGDDPNRTSGAPATAPADRSVASEGELAAMREELTAMRDELAAASDLRTDEPSDRAERATRSASAYLEARRARLKRELRDLRELH